MPVAVHLRPYLGVAPAHIGQIKSQCFVRLRSFFSADVAELEDRHAVWGIIGATTPAASASALPNVRKYLHLTVMMTS